MATAFNYGGTVEVEPALAPMGGSTAQVMGALETIQNDATVMLVGHEPSIRTVAAFAADVAHLPAFRTASACLVERSAERGQFVFWMDPTTTELVRDIESLPIG